MLDWKDLATYDNITNRKFNAVSTIYNVKNLWTGKEEPSTEKNREITVPGYDVALYRLTPKTK